MEHNQVTQVLHEVMSLLIQVAPPGWKRIFLNFETLDEEQQLCTSSEIVAVMKPLFGKAFKKQFPVPEKASDLMTEAALHFMEKAKQNYVTLDLLFWNNGKFKTYIDYEPLERLGGDIQAGGRYRRYVDDDPLLKDL